MGKAKRLRRDRARRRRSTVGRYRRPAEILLDLRARSVTEAELEEWQQYADRIGIGAERNGYQTIVVPSHGDAQDEQLGKLYARARLRLRKGRLQEDGATLWFELHGPDGWVQVGRRVHMPIDAEIAPA